MHLPFAGIPIFLIDTPITLGVIGGFVKFYSLSLLASFSLNVSARPA
jgi:hypothetical protein